MSKNKRIIRALFLLILTGLGYGMLVGLFSSLNMDLWYEYALFMLAAMAVNWFGINFNNGSVNASFAIVFSGFLVFGSGPTVWIGALASLFSNGIINKGQPFGQTLYNGAQSALTITLAAFLYTLVGGLSANRLGLANLTPLVTFVVCYFVFNQLFINFYLNTYSRRSRMWWKQVVRWDVLLFSFSVPIAIGFASIYFSQGLTLTILAFIPLLFLQKLIQVYINLDIANRELRALYQVTKTIGNELDVQKTLDAILKEILSVINYHTGVIYLYHDAKGCLIARAIESPQHDQIRKQQILIGEGIIGTVAENKQPELIDDVFEEPLLQELPGIHQFLRSLLVVPMLVGNKVVGVIALGSKNRAEFSEEQLKLLSILAGQAAVATANSLLYRKVGNMAVTDGLTKVYNHRFFYSKLEEEYNHCQKHNQTLSIMLLDIDNFKRFNDQYGHLSGDMALNSVARILMQQSRDRDTVARYGGEEFALILPGTDHEGAYLVGERIREAIAKYPFKPKVDQPAVNLTVSIGITISKEGHSMKDLVDEADKILYQAKRMGKNRVEISKN